MSYKAPTNYASYVTKDTPYSMFSSLVAPSHEPIVKPITNHSGDELKAFWQPEAVDNNKLLHDSGIKTNSDYRKYMTHKATIIRDHNHRVALK